MTPITNTTGTFALGPVDPDELEAGAVAYVAIEDQEGKHTMRVLLNDKTAANAAALLENLRNSAKLAKTQDPLPIREGAVTLDSGVSTKRGDQ